MSRTKPKVNDYWHHPDEDKNIEELSENENSIPERRDTENLSNDGDGDDDIDDKDDDDIDYKDDDDTHDSDDHGGGLSNQQSNKKRHLITSSGLSVQRVKVAKLTSLPTTDNSLQGDEDVESIEQGFTRKSKLQGQIKQRNEEIKANIIKNSQRRQEFLRLNWRLLAPFLDLTHQSCPEPCSTELVQEFKKYKFPALSTQPSCLRNVSVKDYQLDGVNWVS